MALPKNKTIQQSADPAKAAPRSRRARRTNSRPVDGIPPPFGPEQETRERLERELRATREELRKTQADLSAAQRALEGSGKGLWSTEEERARLAAIVSSANDAVIGKTLDGIITSWNAAAERLFGYRADEICGNSIDLLIPDAIRPELHRLYDEAAAGVARGPTRTMRRAKDGREILVVLTLSPIRDADGRVIGISSISHHISGHERPEPEAGRAGEDLAAQLADMTKLHQLSQRLVDGRDFDALLDEIVRSACELLDADMGNVQLVDSASGRLRLAVHHGYNDAFLEAFGDVGPGVAACGHALVRKSRVIIQDTESDPLIGDLLETVRTCGYRAAQSTPLLNSRGEVVGALSTHWREPHQPGARQLKLLDLFARFAAEIIERAQSRAALAASRERFRLAALATNDALWDWDLRSGRQWWNDAYTVTYGRPPESDHSRDWWREHVHPEDRERAEQSLHRALAGDDASWAAGYRFLRADGKWASVYDRAYIARDASGRPTRVVGSMLDLTEDLQLSTALRESRQRFAQLLTLMPAAVYTCDAAGRITFFNRHAADLWGREPRLGDPDESFAAGFRWWRGDGAPLPYLESPMALALREGRPARHEEIIFERADGRRITTAVNIDPLFDAAGRRVGAINVSQDISELRHATEIVRRQQDQLREVTDLAPVMLVQCDRQHRYTFANRAVTEHHGLELNELLGRSLAEAIGPRAFQVLLPYIERVLQGERQDFEVLVPYPRLGERFMRASCVPCRRADGEITGWIAAMHDVTESKAMENALHESESRFRSMADAAPVLVWMAGVHARATWFNRGWLEFVGQPIEKELGDGWLAHVHPEDRPRCIRTMATAFAARTPFELDHRLRRADGRYRWIVSRGVPLYGSDGAFAGYIGSCIDITERKDAHRQLERQARMLELAHDAIVVWAWKGSINYWSRGAELLYGYTAPEAVGQISHRLLRTEVPGGVAALEAALEQQGEWRGELIHHTRDGRSIVVDSRLVLSRRAGEPALVVETNRDITDRRRAEDALRKTEDAERKRRAELEALMQGAPAMIWMSEDPECRVITGNPAAYALARLPPGSNLSLQAPENAASPPFEIWRDGHRLETSELPQQLAARTGERIENQELEFRFADGTSRWIFGNACALFDQQGRVRGSIAAFIDITDRKRAEQELQRAQRDLLRHSQELERTVAQRTARLRETIADLEAFSYSVSHDLRSPLRTMHGFADALLEDYGNRLDEPGRDYLFRIKVGAERLDRLTNDLLAYSRASREQPENEEVDLDELLADAIQHVPEFRKHAGAIEVRSPLLPVTGHRTALAQCLSNLLSNALKFVVPGQPPRVEVWTEWTGGQVRLNVRDHGIGIAPEDQARVFGLFERLNPRHAYEGTGIGLAIVKKAVERMNGRIGIESTPGEGSRFWIELPAASTADRAEPVTPL